MKKPPAWNLKKYEIKQRKEAAEKMKDAIFDGITKTFIYSEIIDEEDNEKLEK